MTKREEAKEKSNTDENKWGQPNAVMIIYDDNIGRLMRCIARKVCLLI